MRLSLTISIDSELSEPIENDAKTRRHIENYLVENVGSLLDELLGELKTESEELYPVSVDDIEITES